MEKELAENFGDAGKKRMARYFRITIALAIATMSVFWIAFRVYPSEPHMTQVANLVT